MTADLIDFSQQPPSFANRAGRESWLLCGSSDDWTKLVDQLAIQDSIAVYLMRRHSADEVRRALKTEGPTMLLLEWLRSTREVAERICDLTRREFPQVSIVAAIPNQDTENRVRALNAGADDCVGYEIDQRELAARARAIARRQSSSRPPRVYSIEERATLLADQYRLSPREQEILMHLAHGIHLKLVADSLGCSYATVRTHVRRLCTKMDCTCQREVLAKLVADEPDPIVYPIC